MQIDRNSPNWNRIAPEKSLLPFYVRIKASPSLPPRLNCLMRDLRYMPAPSFSLSLLIETHTTILAWKLDFLQYLTLADHSTYLMHVLGLEFIAITTCELQRIWSSLFSILSLFSYSSQQTRAVWYLCHLRRNF